MSKEATSNRRLGKGLRSMLSAAPPVSVLPNDLAAPKQSPISLNSDAAPTDPASLAAGGASGPSAEQAPHAPAEAGGLVVEHIDVGAIATSPFQPRQSMDESALVGLAESIRASGMMQPVLVRPATPGRYELIAGERRWRAAQRAGLTRVPAIVRTLDDRAAAEHALVENVQREDLNAMDKAWALRRMSERFGLTHTELAGRIGLERSSVANMVRLTELEEDVQAMVRTGALSFGHARALLGIPAGPGRSALATRAHDESWSVRRLEEEARRSGKPTKVPAPRAGIRPAIHGEIEKRLAEHLGARVRLRTDRSGARGTLTIDFYDIDHFEGLVRKLGFDTGRLG